MNVESLNNSFFITVVISACAECVNEVVTYTQLHVEQCINVATCNTCIYSIIVLCITHDYAVMYCVIPQSLLTSPWYS